MSFRPWWNIFLSVTRFEINAKPSRYHACYLLAVASLWWLPASFLLSADRVLWFTPAWLLACCLLFYRSRSYCLQGEYNLGELSLNGRRGALSHHCRAGPGFLLLMLDEERIPAFWLFQDAVPDEVYRRLSQLVQQTRPPEER